MREIPTIDEFDAYLDEHSCLDELVVQGVDLSDRSVAIESVSCAGATFLGARLSTSSLVHVLESGAVVFPRLPDLPFDTYRPHLYAQGELLDGWVPGDAASFDRDARDSKIYAWTTQHAKRANTPVLDALARRLPDHAIDDALSEHLATHADIVAVMGGHSMQRTDPAFRIVAELGRTMTREGWHVATGGGPGAMEAANLGAWLAPHGDDALDTAIGLL
jgi:hypothetical protein